MALWNTSTPTPKAKMIANITAGVILFIFLPAGCVYMLSGIKPDPAVTNRTMAVVCAQVRVKSQLKAPSTAKFGWQSEMKIEEKDNSIYKISAYVDSQNSFGAMVRTNFICDVVVNPDGKNCDKAICEFQQ